NGAANTRAAPGAGRGASAGGYRGADRAGAGGCPGGRRANEAAGAGATAPGADLARPCVGSLVTTRPGAGDDSAGGVVACRLPGLQRLALRGCLTGGEVALAGGQLALRRGQIGLAGGEIRRTVWQRSASQRRRHVRRCRVEVLLDRRLVAAA